MIDRGCGRGGLSVRVRGVVAPHTCGSVGKCDFGGRIIDCHLERISRKGLQILEDPGELVRPLLVLRDEVRDLVKYGPGEGIYYRVGVIRGNRRLLPVNVQARILLLLLLLLLYRKHHGS